MIDPCIPRVTNPLEEPVNAGARTDQSGDAREHANIVCFFVWGFEYTQHQGPLQLHTERP